MKTIIPTKIPIQLMKISVRFLSIIQAIKLLVDVQKLLKSLKLINEIMAKESIDDTCAVLVKKS